MRIFAVQAREKKYHARFTLRLHYFPLRCSIALITGERRFRLFSPVGRNSHVQLPLYLIATIPFPQCNGQTSYVVDS